MSGVRLLSVPEAEPKVPPGPVAEALLVARVAPPVASRIPNISCMLAVLDTPISLITSA